MISGGGEALGTYVGKLGAVWFDAGVDHEYIGVRPAIVLEGINPYTVIDNCIVFGEYPQTIADKDLTSTMSNVPDVDGYFLNSTNGERYAKIISTPFSNNYSFSTGDTILGATEYYFLVEPIRWRILEDTGFQMFLMADLSIDVLMFDSGGVNDWDTSSIRDWLNNQFYEVAFNSIEQSIIMTTVITPPVTTGTSSSVTTNDKVFIISSPDAIETAYGFNINPNFGDLNRKSYTTDYSLARGIFCPENPITYYAYSSWWLRTLGSNNHSVSFVSEGGWLMLDMDVVDEATGVRPALVIDTT